MSHTQKMLSNDPELNELVRRALGAVAALPPEEQERLHAESRASFARGQVAMHRFESRYRRLTARWARLTE